MNERGDNDIKTYTKTYSFTLCAGSCTPAPLCTLFSSICLCSLFFPLLELWMVKFSCSGKPVYKVSTCDLNDRMFRDLCTSYTEQRFYRPLTMFKVIVASRIRGVSGNVFEREKRLKTTTMCSTRWIFCDFSAIAKHHIHPEYHSTTRYPNQATTFPVFCE